MNLPADCTDFHRLGRPDFRRRESRLGVARVPPHPRPLSRGGERGEVELDVELQIENFKLQIANWTGVCVVFSGLRINQTIKYSAVGGINRHYDMVGARRAAYRHPVGAQPHV